MTNGEWLRQLSNEDLADFWANVSGAFCCQYENGERVCTGESYVSCAWCMLKWLNSEKESKLPAGDFERLQGMK